MTRPAERLTSRTDEIQASNDGLALQRNALLSLARELEATNARLETRLSEAHKQLDRFLNEHCKGGEYCELCADIICPHKDTLHFHHDGCPSCSYDVETT